MIEDQTALAQFSGTARLFPIPNLVFFPTVVQQLHIFENRYRHMMADALADDKLIAIVLLQGDWEETYDESPEIANVACLGRITQHVLLPDGRYNLRLRGISRIQLVEEIATDKPYRMAHAAPFSDIVTADVKLLMQLRRELGTVVLSRFDPAGPAHAQLTELFRGETPLGPLCDMLTHALPIDLPTKQLLLAEPHVHHRAVLLTEVLRVPAPETVREGLIQLPRKYPPDFSAN